jgi:molybdopterin molybdotransferase
VVAGPVAVGQHVRPRGGDAHAGDTVVPAGARLGPVQIGALSATGVAEVACATRPRVAVLATGSELRAAGDPLAAGQIYESNRAMIAAVLTRANADVELLPVVADDAKAHRDAIANGLDADVLVTSGGVSMGEHDLVRSTAAELGVKEIFWGVAVKPGKPLSFGVRGRTLVFGLPGNPVSSLVGFELFVRPAVLALQGLAEPLPQFEPGTIDAAIGRNPHRDELVRARSSRVDGAVSLEPLRGQESHMIARAAASDALVFVPRGTGELPTGTRVEYLRLS